MTASAHDLAAALRDLAVAVSDLPPQPSPEQSYRLELALRAARTELYLYDQSQLPGHAY